MKYHEASHIIWLEKEIQVLTSPTSYLHTQDWQLGKKKEKHPLSDKLVEAVKKFKASQSDEDKIELQNIINELKDSFNKK